MEVGEPMKGHTLCPFVPTSLGPFAESMSDYAVPGHLELNSRSGRSNWPKMPKCFWPAMTILAIFALLKQRVREWLYATLHRKAGYLTSMRWTQPWALKHERW